MTGRAHPPCNLALLIAALTAPCIGVQADTLSLHGVVREPGTDQPVASAEISLIRIPDARPAIVSALDLEKPLSTGTTDAQGAFTFAPLEPGAYRVTAQKDGFTQTSPPLHSSSASAELTLSKEHPSADVHLQLGRPGRLSGTIVDAESGKPVPNLQVQAGQLFYTFGRRRIGPGAAVVTSADGAFSAPSLRPGNYILRVRPPSERTRLHAQWAPEDVNSTDVEYQPAYFPGGADLNAATPLTVLPQGGANAGLLRVHKVTQYRALISIPARGCQQGEPVEIGEVILVGVYSDRQDLGRAVCGEQFQLRNLLPGAHELVAWMPAGRRESRVRGAIAFTVSDRNVEATINLVRGADIDGQVTFAPGSLSRAVSNLHIGMRPVAGIPYSDETPVSADAKGTFRIPNVQASAQWLDITGIDPPLYLREVRYNGAKVSSRIVPLNPHAFVQQLELVLDDKPASIAGIADENDKLVPNPYVVLISWPCETNDVFLSVIAITGDIDGRFEFAAVPPGEYRILALAQASKDKLEEPYVLQNLLNRAAKLTLQASGASTLKLEPTDPAR